METVSIVDRVVTYECPYSGKSYVLLCHNALPVPSMVNTLIPQFIMRGAGVVVKDTPKIHVDMSTKEDHYIYNKDED